MGASQQKVLPQQNQAASPIKTKGCPVMAQRSSGRSIGSIAGTTTATAWPSRLNGHPSLDGEPLVGCWPVHPPSTGSPAGVASARQQRTVSRAIRVTSGYQTKPMLTGLPSTRSGSGWLLSKRTHSVRLRHPGQHEGELGGPGRPWGGCWPDR